MPAGIETKAGCHVRHDRVYTDSGTHGGTTGSATSRPDRRDAQWNGQSERKLQHRLLPDTGDDNAYGNTVRRRR